MIDIHCHILCEMDDGARDMEESLEMARISLANGVTHIVATPHFTEMFQNRKPRVEHKTKQLQTALNEHGIPLTVSPGNEVRLENKAFIRKHLRSGSFAYLDPAKRFVLLEQRWSDYDEDTPEILNWFAGDGTTVIMPHPERHLFFREQPQLIEKLIEAGIWTQITVDSLIGGNGEQIQQFAHLLVRQNLVHAIATDAHNIRRKPNMSAGFDVIRELAGERRVQEIKARMNSIFPH